MSIQAALGWALAISLHQSMALPTQPRRPGQRAGNRRLSLPPSLHHSLPGHLCLASLPLRRPCFCVVPSHNLRLSASCRRSPPPLCSRPAGAEFVPPRVCLHADTPTQMIRRSSCPERSSGCQLPHRQRRPALCQRRSLLAVFVLLYIQTPPTKF